MTFTRPVCALVLVGFIPLALCAQAAPVADSGSLVLIALRKPRPAIVVGSAGNERVDPNARDLPIRGVVVTRPPLGDTLAITDAAGTTVVRGLPSGRVGLLMSVAGYRPLRCRLAVRAGAADTVRAYLLPDDRPEAFNSTASGCRQTR